MLPRWNTDRTSLTHSTVHDRKEHFAKLLGGEDGELRVELSEV